MYEVDEVLSDACDKTSHGHRLPRTAFRRVSEGSPAMILHGEYSRMVCMLNLDGVYIYFGWMFEKYEKDCSLRRQRPRHLWFEMPSSGGQHGFELIELMNEFCYDDQKT